MLTLPAIMPGIDADRAVRLDVSDSGEDPYAELSTVEAQVTSVSATLEALVHRVHVLKAKINSIHSPIMRSLPSELLAEIFSFCIPPFEAYHKGFPTGTPLRLGAVCSGWRNIVWDHPGLWSSLTLHLSSKRMLVQRELLDQWLARTGMLPLHIRLVYEEDVIWNPIAEQREHILLLLNRYARRFRRLDLRVPTSFYRFLPSAEELPELQSVYLNPSGGQGDRKHRVDLQNTPQLTHVTLCCVYFYAVSFEWSRLTHLHVESFYVDECLAALKHTTALVSCTIRNVIGGDDGHPLPHEPIELRQLETLSIDNEKEASLALLFNKLTLPNLRAYSYSSGSFMNVAEFTGLIARSRCSIRMFSLLGSDATESTMEQLLEAMGSLNRLVIRAPKHCKELFTTGLINACNPLLSRLDKLQCLLPELRELEYEGPHLFSWDALLSTLEARRADKQHLATELGQFGPKYVEVSSLRTVSLDLHTGELEAEQIERLEKLGLEIRIRVSGGDIVFVRNEL